MKSVDKKQGTRKQKVLGKPRFRNQESGEEVSMAPWRQIKGSGEVDDGLLQKVLVGISCHNYEEAVQAISGSIGLSSTSVLWFIVEASAKQLKEF